MLIYYILNCIKIMIFFISYGLIEKKTPMVLNLGEFAKFKDHPIVTPFINKYEFDSSMALYAIPRLIKDLEEINSEYMTQHNRVLFTSIEGRVKSRDSFLNKFYDRCCIYSDKIGISKKNFEYFYAGIKDIAGVRFSCPYYDEVECAINEIIRPKLKDLGYATNLEDENFKDENFKDKNYLDEGDENGYRSYHFYLKIPTQINIFGEMDSCLCEVQGRSELQHIWAVKSHDLLYKVKDNGILKDKIIQDDMKQLSNSLRVADQSLVSIKNRIKGGNEIVKSTYQS